MCTFFSNVKSSLLWHWEADIVEKSTQFTKKDTQSRQQAAK